MCVVERGENTQRDDDDENVPYARKCHCLYTVGLASISTVGVRHDENCLGHVLCRITKQVYVKHPLHFPL